MPPVLSYGYSSAVSCNQLIQSFRSALVDLSSFAVRLVQLLLGIWD